MVALAQGLGTRPREGCVFVVHKHDLGVFCKTKNSVFCRTKNSVLRITQNTGEREGSVADNGNVLNDLERLVLE